jgi:hypothetical protein
MSNSYRVRTEVGKDKSIKVLLDQDFEFLEVLSFKISQTDIYTRQCSDYGVVIGRVTTNGGFGIPNSKVSIFVPLTDEDENNPVITELYPYKKLTDTNDDGYRYNLLPKVKSYSEHSPTGSFFTKDEVLTNQTIIEVFDKYYKYTSVTNDSGDFMIFGVPVGQQQIHMDVDLSDIGEFSQSPQDLIRVGVANEEQVAGTKFKTASNLSRLPQIVTIDKQTNVEPLWGQPEVCNLGITRVDFDLSEELNITIQPTAIFMGSMISDLETLSLRKNCKPKFKQGELCNLVAGPGQILAIRQTIFDDSNGRPVLESFDLDNGGQVIDEDGTWLLDIPMNMDYITTNEFGERVISNDPKVGIPTTAKYRFKVKWNQSPSLSENIKRGYFLVPNIREYGWDSNGSTVDLTQQLKSYSFSLDWDDYADIQSAIDCEDTFYPMVYNKVYTVSQMIDRFRNGTLPNRFVSIKNILDDRCESEHNKFPANDSVYRTDILFLLFQLLVIVARALALPLVAVIHIVYFLIDIVKNFGILVAAFLALLAADRIIDGSGFVAASFYYIFQIIPPSPIPVPVPQFDIALFLLGLKIIASGAAYLASSVALVVLYLKLKDAVLDGFKLPLLLYDQCEFCNCSDGPSQNTPEIFTPADFLPSGSNINTDLSTINILQFNNSTYNVGNGDQNIVNLNNVLGGYPTTTPPNCQTKIPYIYEAFLGASQYYYFTSSLTLPERINLFNTKAKYFENNPTNPGGGVNKIKVRIEPTLNPDPNNYHTDNIVVILLDKLSVDYIDSGMIFTFQNPDLNTDKNLTGSTRNSYDNNAVTGTCLNNTSITLNYVKPNGSNGTVTYQIPQPNPEDANYNKYPSDIEYFQVITAMTYGNFSSQCGTSLDNSLNERFLNNDMRINRISIDTNSSNNNCVTNTSDNPMTSYTDYQQQIILFLVRGVDPYSTRVDIEYDLSKIFGYSNFGVKKFRGNFKLNIPINGGFKNVSHDILNNSDTDPYSNMNLYYDSFNYQPSTFLTFNSKLPKYYSNLDNKNNLFTPSCSCLVSVSTGAEISVNGLRVNINNHFTREWNVVETTPCTYYKFEFNDIIFTPTQNRGYFINEIVEGGSLMIMDATIPYPTSPLNPVVYAGYMSPIYDTTTPMSFDGGVSGRKIIMRSDRLPASTNLVNNCDTSLLLQQNNELNFYEISDEGYIPDRSQAQSPATSPGNYDGDPTTAINSQVVNSLNSCKDSVNLECYSFSNGEFTIQYGDCQNKGGEQIFGQGCYILVTRPFKSLNDDKKLFKEWLSRINISFGACRNVFSHVFTNNWINGTLYSVSFKNERLFDSNNQPYSEICNKIVYFNNNDKNFYYRSSPYHSGATEQYFVGSSSGQGGNNRNLKTPTTIIDLGPRSNYIQEIVYSDKYDGYTVNKLNSTTFGDVSDLINIFVLSRLVNSSIRNQMLSAEGANIFTFFNKRNSKFVDGDYAQMVSINSEIGVNEFDSANYPTNPTGQDPIYFNNGNSNDGIFGIFFSSDTQIRDYISPKREIINTTAPITQQCAFNNIPTFSQEVPFYQWGIKQNLTNDSIFGSQNNEWYTEKLGSKFLSYRYQTLDRLNTSSRYFRGQGSTSDYFKGYIFSRNPSTGELDPNSNSQSGNYPLPRVITVGAPYYFYFGLKKGRSSFDKFYRKWINSDNVID